ncbi:hypothetical protein K504DRAFT_463583 [Pleomassaria siparia CBS 279.74]|uniref:Uncharacterized protein n=1 Tax=Pleomassaria siparia CBS 279.74 TaxID=1314801 RepID=A0A6G1JSP6_9PLEO|nr:hypothetical protein K504DRAFT_463583 [Pleomassaria siparia CBS 279.74]
MQPNERVVSINEDSIGLDRAAIDRQIQHPQQHPQTSDKVTLAHNHVGELATDSALSLKTRHIRNSISEKRHGAAVKLRKTLHISKPVDCAVPEAILANPIADQSDSRLGDAQPSPDKTTLKEMIHNPVDMVKSKISCRGNHQIATNMATKEIPHGKDVDLLNAKTALEEARSDAEKALATQNMDELMKERQKMFVRWTIDRHVTKVRIIPRDSFARKTRANFTTTNVHGRTAVDWKAYTHHLLEYFAGQYGGQYIGYGSDPPLPCKESIMPIVERLIVASAPFQGFIMTTRRIYMWHSPSETFTYLMTYLLLWYFNLVFPAALSTILYFIVKRYFNGNTLKDLRQHVQRTEDVLQTALTLTECVEKKGDEQWADELLQELGPWLMIQLCDMADFFEVMRNFYEWRHPSQTVGTLVLFVVAIMATAVAPVWLLVKCATLGAGITFFGLFSIASNFPEYRLLVSPIKRVFWNIPTHAQWAIESLQAEGSRYENEHFTEQTSSSKTDIRVDSPTVAKPNTGETHDRGSYTAHHNGTKGSLVIGSTSVRFESEIRHRVHWTVLYEQINNLEKVDRFISKDIPTLKTYSKQDLKLVSKTGDEWVLQDVEQRNQAFSQILGFSDAAWQVVWSG